MPKILFVEDDPFIAEIYIKKFESSGFEVKNVATGKAVLKAIQEEDFDLTLLDLVIPELSGMEVLEQLQKNAQDYPKRSKVIVFSNLSSPEDRQRCLDLGADGFISKTEFSPSQVVDEVNRFLRQFNEQNKNHARHTSSENGEAATSKNKKILFIEDEPVFVEMFTKRLRDEGYEVTAKHDGIEGLKEASLGGYDMVISDIMMPGLNGKDMVHQLRETEEGKNVPVILLSASVEIDEMEELSKAGIANHVFMKTQITPSDLVYAVNNFFAAQ
ncbi:MAG: response regulator [Candidatus Moraniibacteriota bacterium]